MECLHGLANVNIELTSRCNKNCWMCGRRKVDRGEYPDLQINYGDMDFDLVKHIANQLPPNIVVQFHKDGEALLYPNFGKVVSLFKKQIKNVVSNGKLIIKKADEIIGNLDTLSISIFEGDTEADAQYDLIVKFLKIKKDKKPFTTLRLVGDVDSSRYEKLNALIIRRILHHPMGSFKYRKKNPTIPEIGVCLDFLRHMCISREGKVSICVRFDPSGLGIIGDAKETPLANIWNSKKRLEWLEYHRMGKRDLIGLCRNCEYWGVPTGI